MSDKLNKETARQKFRSSVSINDIHNVENKDSRYTYKYVAATFTEGLKRIDRYIDGGWEVVYSKDKTKDDRKNTAQGTDEQARVPKPVQMTTRGGQTMILMKCLKETRNKNEAAKAARDKARDDASRKHKTTQTGNTTNISEEVNLNDPN